MKMLLALLSLFAMSASQVVFADADKEETKAIEVVEEEVAAEAAVEEEAAE